MEQTQLITLILSSTVVGGIVTKLFDILRDWLAGHMQKRRAEVDKAIAERNKARTERDEARAQRDAARAGADAELRWWTRWADVIEESLRIHRRQMIDAPCIDVDDLPPYPTRPDKEKP